MSSQVQSPTSNVQSPLAAAVLPQVLKDAGWKLERKILNDDHEHPQFQIRNEKLQLTTATHKTLDDAIEAALILQTRSEGKKVSRVKIKERVKGMKSGDRSQESGAGLVLTSLLEIKKMRRDGGTQPREGLDQETVERYAEAKKAGAVFEPSVVFYDGKNYWLARGFHRTAADEKNGQKKTLTEIRQGTQRDAILFSLGENAEHGLPRTNEQKRNAVMTILRDKEWSDWSNGMIADKTKTSATFVGKLRKTLPASTQNVSSSQSTVRIGKDKRVRETKAIGRKKTEDRGQRSEVSGQTEPVEEIKVTDKRRFAEEGVRDSKQSLIAGETPAVPVKAVRLEELLKGRMLTISFGWIPKVPGVNVTVNASTDREKATRKLIGLAEVPAMPEVVIEMVAAALGEKGPTSNVESPKPKKRRTVSPAQKKLTELRKKKRAKAATPTRRGRTPKTKPAKKR